jgi:hypothetical protein
MADVMRSIESTVLHVMQEGGSPHTRLSSYNPFLTFDDPFHGLFVLNIVNGVSKVKTL